MTDYMKTMPLRSSLFVMSLLAFTASVFCLFPGRSHSTEILTGANSNNVSAYKTCAQGHIYVTAVKAEDRVASETWKPKHIPINLHARRTNYQKPTARGVYAISGLDPCQHAVWLYMDTAGEGGVNHHEFADPVG